MEKISALNLDQTLIIEILSFANENNNIRNIIWNVQGLKTGIYFGIGKINSPGWTWKVTTQVLYIPFV